MGSKLSAFGKTARANYGSGAIGRGDTTPSEDRRLPSGSIRLDHGLGGGYRVGWITSLYGEKSGGKTSTAIRAAALAQHYCRNCYRHVDGVEAVEPSAEALKENPDERWTAKGQCTCYAEGIYKPDRPDKIPNEKPKAYRERMEQWEADMQKNSYEEFICAWIDMENAFDKKWAAKIGIDNRRLFWARPESAEEAIDIMHSLVCTVEVDWMCIDSIAQLVPEKELTEAMEKWQQGLQARLVNKASRKLVSGSSVVANSSRAITQIWINQVREKITMFGDPTVKPGGKGQEFAVHAEIKFKKSKQELISEQYGTKDDQLTIPVAETFSFTVTKQRTAGTRGVSGHYIQRMRDNNAGGKAGEVMQDEDVFKLAMHFLVDQTKKGSGSVYSLAGTDYTSQKTLAKELREDPELGAVVRETLLARMLQGAV